MDKKLSEIAKELRNLKHRRKILKAVLDALDAKIEQAEAQVEEQMSSAGIESFVTDGAEYHIKQTISTSIVKEYLPELITAAKANGCGELVKTSINTNSLSAYVRKYVIENDGLFPEWVNGFVDYRVHTQIIIKELNGGKK